MRIIHISKYDHNTMQLAKPIFDHHRRVLLAARHVIHPKYLEKLLQIGIRQLVVEDSESRGITLEEMIDVPTWMDVVALVQEFFSAPLKGVPFPIKSLLAAVGRLLMEIRNHPVLLPVPEQTLPDPLRPYARSVNVALLALQVARNLGYNEIMMRDLAVGCLLHNIGSVIVKDPAEFPEVGFNLIRSIREFSLLSAHVVFQHREKMDGSGYPRRLSGDTFHEYAQICGICNLYEELISAKDMPPHMAMEHIMTLSDSAYRVDIVRAFVNAVPSYPPGTKICMQDGQEAIVIKIAEHMQRPVIRYLSSGAEVSLADNPTLIIAKSC
ncbi:HD-GYP domain-containing protein [Paenibacillus sp. YN15]|uniref:HD-GYP domain-containing protein n=1 Tax=Paenibacillus sp. YN15 TaxID=1742774 RepID=UPI000DCE7955|nr:HD domain-containing phosphohydrolase [Paenibacillus sp. YN15]RAV00561.1 c-di-GMP phosphodiesterase [Paenibacillus sp. YN15]